MLTNFHQLIEGRRSAPREYDLAFVREVSVGTRPVHHPRFERWILTGWVLIAGKCWLVTWLVEKYRGPIAPLWIIAPTVLFALLCTAVYFGREYELWSDFAY